MGLINDIKEAHKEWNTKGVLYKLIAILSLFLAISSVTSLADKIIEWKSFIRDGLDFYNYYYVGFFQWLFNLINWKVDPIAIAINTIFLLFSAPIFWYGIVSNHLSGFRKYLAFSIIIIFPPFILYASPILNLPEKGWYLTSRFILYWLAFVFLYFKSLKNNVGSSQDQDEIIKKHENLIKEYEVFKNDHQNLIKRDKQFSSIETKSTNKESEYNEIKSEVKKLHLEAEYNYLKLINSYKEIGSKLEEQKFLKRLLMRPIITILIVLVLAAINKGILA